MYSNIYIGKLNSDNIEYPDAKEYYSPSIKYPEYIFQDNISSTTNYIYDQIRDGFHALNYDIEHYGLKSWNPLSKLIKEGDIVVIKPNMVRDKNGNPAYGLDCLITHPSLVRVVIDYVIIALNGSGKIIIADAPVQSCNFQNLIENSGYKQILEFYSKHEVKIQLIDLRDYAVKTDKLRLKWKYTQLSNEHIVVNLGNESLFGNLPNARYPNLRITDYDPKIMLEHQR